MDIKVMVIDGIGYVRYRIPPGTYPIEVIRTNGCMMDLQSEPYPGSGVTNQITFSEEIKKYALYIDALGAATVAVMERRADGKVVPLESLYVKGIRILRTNVDGTVTEDGKTFEESNEITFSHLPYGDGSKVSFAIDTDSLQTCRLCSEKIVTKQVMSTDASETRYEFVVEKVKEILVDTVWHVNELASPISKKIDEVGDGSRNGYLGVTGIINLTRVDK